MWYTYHAFYFYTHTHMSQKVLVPALIIGSVLALTALTMSARSLEVKPSMKNRPVASGEVRTLVRAHSGEIRDAVRSLTGTDRSALKDIRKEQKGLVQSLSGKTLEQKATERQKIETLQKQKIELRYKNATGSLAEDRMKLYDANKEKRENSFSGRLALQQKLGTAIMADVDSFLAKVQSGAVNMPADKKVEVLKKIDERIAKINANKNIPEATRSQILEKLKGLKDQLSK